jgi:hypothetical protein
MTHGGRHARCSDVSNDGASRSKRAASIRAESNGQPLRTKRKTARVNGHRRVRGWRKRYRASAGKEATSPKRPQRDRRDRMAASGKRDVTSEHCRGQEPQERRPVDHATPHSSPPRSRGEHCVTACTRPDRRRRIGYAVPERAVASRCVEAHADAARPPLIVTRQTRAGAVTGHPQAA